jgi:NCS2 family nucleobase:cation symporter-2/xanthine permease
MENMVNREIHDVDEKLPFGKLGVLGIQHVLAMYVGAVTIPLVLSSAVGLTTAQLELLISADLFTCGIGTLIQSWGFKNFIGIKLPVILGCAFAGIAPMIAIAHGTGLTGPESLLLVYGSIIGAGIFLFLLAPLVGKIIKLFPPVVIGSELIIVGFSLLSIGVTYAGGGYSDSFGEPKNFILAGLVMVIIIIINKYFTGFIQAIAVLIGIIAGTIIAAFMGMVDFSPVMQAQWVGVVKPFVFGLPRFSIVGIIMMCVVILIAIVESLGAFFAVSDICNKKLTDKDIVKGLRAEGIACVLGGIFNSFPYTTYSQNVGLVGLAKVTSRYVTVAGGIILMILGLMPKFSALVTIVPSPVLGGAMIIMFCMVGMFGIKLVQSTDLNNNGNMLTAACSIGIGLGITAVPGLFDKMPGIIGTFFGSSGVVPGAIIAVLLNLFFNHKEIFQRAEKEEQSVV